MSLTLTVSNQPEDVVLHRNVFPAGESFHRIEGDLKYLTRACFIQFDFENTGELIELAMLADAIRRQRPDAKIHLIMKYLPFARQDRVCNPGDPLAVAVVAKLINSLNFETVTCFDLHSDVSCALIDRLHHVEQHQAAEALKMALEKVAEPKNLVLLSPDAGAAKKTFKMAQAMGVERMVEATKIRDPKTGAIISTSIGRIPDGGDDILIVDDICDGGRTFIEIAKQFKLMRHGDGRMMLYVTHGIFTKGYEELREHFSHIFTANLMGKPDPLVTVI